MRTSTFWRGGGTSPCDDAHGETFDDGGFAHACFTGEDGIILAAAGEDVHDLADFEIAAKDGVYFAFAGVFGEVDGELIEIGRFTSAGRATFGGGRTGFCETSGQRGCGFGRAFDDVVKFAEQLGRFDQLKFGSDFVGDAAEVFVGNEREDAIAGTDLAGGEFERGEGPGFGKHLFKPLAEAGRAGIAAAIGVEGAGEFFFEAAGIDIEVLDDVVKVVVLLIEEFGKEVLDFDGVMRVGQAEATGVVEGFVGGFVGFGDEGFQVNGHG